MSTKIYHVVLSNGGYFITRNLHHGDKIMFTGSWQACRQYIDPLY